MELFFIGLSRILVFQLSGGESTTTPLPTPKPTALPTPIPAASPTSPTPIPTMNADLLLCMPEAFDANDATLRVASA